MTLELQELKELHDKAYNFSQITRERAADDLVFYFISHWDDSILNDSQLSYKGEFDILKKGGRQIMSDLAANPVQVDFEPIDEERKDSGELVDGMYRLDDNDNMSIESYENGKQESVVCGVGAWELYTEYVSMRTGNDEQVIKRRPLYEANNTVFWDPNGKSLDKSNAVYCSVLTSYSEDGYKKLVKELTGEEIETVNAESFKQPEHSYAFPWIGGEGKKIYVVKFYYREKVKNKILTMTNPFGETLVLRESALNEVMDDMLDQGFSIESSKDIERYQVTRYIASGEKILSTDIIAGEHIPVVPIYGEHAYIEGEEHYEGVTRLAKDPQRLRDFIHSYIADIASRSPRVKPIFWPEQIAGFKDMYEESGSENNYPYLFMNMFDANGNQLPLGPVGMMPEQPVPTALVQLTELTRQSVEDVVNPGIPQDIADPDLSGKAVLALMSRLDMQSMIYQEHYKHGKRRDADIYASIASEINDTPRKTKVEMSDGTRKEIKIMEQVIDKETGDIVTLNDLRGVEFNVYSKIGPSYSSQKEQTIDRIEKMVGVLDPNDPIRKALQLKQLMLMDGVDFDDIREYANKQLVLMGIKEPETEEETQMLAQAQAQQQGEQDPGMALAQAEMEKARADQMEAQIKNIQVQLNAQNEMTKRRIDQFKAETERMNLQVDAHEAGANINMKNIESFGKQIDNNEGPNFEKKKPSNLNKVRSKLMFDI